MFISMLLLFVFFILTSAAAMFFFCIFIPQLKERFTGINSLLSTEGMVILEQNDKIDSKKPDLTKKAFVAVSVDKSKLERRLEYNGLKSCALFHSLYGSEIKDYDCCIGFGDCVSFCPQVAISVKNGLAVIDNSCDGCGQCLNVCPLKLISLVSSDSINYSDNNKISYKLFYKCYKLLSKRR